MNKNLSNNKRYISCDKDLKISNNNVYRNKNNFNNDKIEKKQKNINKTIISISNFLNSIYNCEIDKKIGKDYKINKCKENGHLPSLKPHCESMLNKIEILKNKKIPKLSAFSIWLGDIYDRLIDTFGYINTIIIIVLYIIILIIIIKI